MDPSGAKKFGMETVPPLVTRAILVDMVDFLGRNLGESEEISLEDFKACLAKHDLQIQPGDAVLVNTGWMRLLGTEDKKFAASNPGIGEDIAWYLVEKGVVGVGTDQWNTEVSPPQGLPQGPLRRGLCAMPRDPAGQRRLSVPKPQTGRTCRGLQEGREIRLLLQLHPPQDSGHGARYRTAHRHQITDRRERNLRRCRRRRGKAGGQGHGHHDQLTNRAIERASDKITSSHGKGYFTGSVGSVARLQGRCRTIVLQGLDNEANEPMGAARRVKLF